MFPEQESLLLCYPKGPKIFSLGRTGKEGGRRELNVEIELAHEELLLINTPNFH